MTARSSLFVMSAAALTLAAQVFVVGAVAGARAEVAYSEPVWEPTKALADYTRGASYVVDATDTTTVVGETVDGIIKSVRRPAAGPWSAPELVGESKAAIGSPQVAADDEGNVTAVWRTQRAGFTDGVMAATRPAGAGWSEPVRLSVDRNDPVQDQGPLGAYHIALAVSPGGAAAVAWDWGSEDRDKPWRIQSVYRAPGGAWSKVAEVTHARGNHEPQLAIAADATVTLLYTRQPLGHPQTVLTRTRHVGAGWSRARTVTQKGYAPSLAGDLAGDAAVVFTPDFGRVMARYRRAGHSWGDARRISATGVRMNDDFALAMNGRGKALVAMTRRHGPLSLVTRPVHGPWSAPVRVADPTDPSPRVTVALDDAGDTFVGWGMYSVNGIYRSHGGTWTTPFTISPATAVDVLDRLLSQVAPNGDVVVMWEQEDLPLRVRVMTTS